MLIFEAHLYCSVTVWTFSIDLSAKVPRATGWSTGVIAGHSQKHLISGLSSSAAFDLAYCSYETVQRPRLRVFYADCCPAFSKCIQMLVVHVIHSHLHVIQVASRQDACDPNMSPAVIAS